MLVGEGGLEPPRPEGHWHLKPARLPFRHSPGKQPMDHTTLVAVCPNRLGGLERLFPLPAIAATRL